MKLAWGVVELIVKSDNGPALTSLIESWSTLSNEKWMEDDHQEQSCWKFEEQLERRLGMIRTVRSAVKYEAKIDVTHSVWPWIAEQAGFL